MNQHLTIKIFCDGANLTEMLVAHQTGGVSGFTTNPTLMRRAGILDYEVFAREVLAQIPDAPLSLEVFADDFDSMYAQAMKISGWGPHVYVKIPISNTLGESAIPLIQRLNEEGVKVNATAVLTREQVEGLSRALRPDVPSIVSIFAGRIADTGREPAPMMRWAVEILKPCGAEVLWASPREVLNIYQAQECGCHIITVPPDMLAKLATMHNKDLAELSRETVLMFHTDASRAGYTL